MIVATLAPILRKVTQPGSHPGGASLTLRGQNEAFSPLIACHFGWELMRDWQKWAATRSLIPPILTSFLPLRSLNYPAQLFY